MRFYLFIFTLFSGIFWQAQAQVTPTDSIKPNQGNREQQLEEIKQAKKELLTDTLGNEPANAVLLDTTRYNKYGDLLNDDPEYNKRQPIWKPALQVLGTNALFMGYNRYIAKADYAYVSVDTWKTNLKSEPEWDTDDFGINFIGHPYQGTLYFNAARSQGYNYWQSLPFAVAGSLTWEYFGENTLPSYNDMIYTPLNGAALGEILYRISSNILDDRTTGRERVIREISAGLVNPVRGLNRLLCRAFFSIMITGTPGILNWALWVLAGVSFQNYRSPGKLICTPTCTWALHRWPVTAPVPPPIRWDSGITFLPTVCRAKLKLRSV